tara:strand:+ start:244 stop:411 length:168 start_codon:yes stop_codon:yes gene_type:complete
LDPDHDGVVNTGNTNGNSNLIYANVQTKVSLAFLGGAVKDNVTANCAKFGSSTSL